MCPTCSNAGISSETDFEIETDFHFLEMKL